METTATKERICAKLREYADMMGGQNKAANSMKGVSTSIVSQMINGKWELISDEMWRNVASQIGYTETKWEAVETRDMKTIIALLQNAQNESQVMAITGIAGSGKSFCARTYAESNRRVFLLCCNEYWNRKLFLTELLASMGRDFSGYTVGEMMSEVVRQLKQMEKPLIVMDEADKLSDQVLYFFITLYNQLEDRCGIVICATNHLEKRITRGIRINKKGYSEIYSRLGRKFIALRGTTSSDIRKICEANGVTDGKIISEIIDDSESDLRRVKRKIVALRA